MDTKHPIKKKPEPIPHDPRNEPIPVPDTGKGSRSAEEAERKARKEEGVDMKGSKDKLPNGQEANKVKEESEFKEENVVIEDEYGMPTGIQTGQTTRGSYSTDPATGAGRYADHRAGRFGTSNVAQPGNDQEVEPDPIDPQL